MAEQREQAGVLWQLLGTLQPGRETTEEHLAQARDELAAALAGGQSALSILTPLHRDALSTIAPLRAHDLSAISERALLPEGLRGVAALQAQGAQAAAAAVDTGMPRAAMAALRTTPLVAPFGALATEWTRGLAPERSYGPFLNTLGETYWIDFFSPVMLLSLVWAPDPQQKSMLLAMIPVRRRGALRSGRLRLAAGSVWLPTNLLVPGRPANEFIGVRVDGGSLALGGPTQLQTDSIVVNGNWYARLRLNLDRSASPAAAIGVGADATNARVDLPAELALEFGPTGLASVALSDASLAAYGTEATLERNQEHPFYDEPTHSVVVPCNATIENFGFHEQQSTLFRCQSAATVTGAGWAVTTTVTIPDKLGQASGAGYLWLGLGSGLSARWTGLPSPASLAKATLQLAPGTIAIAATIGNQPLQQSLPLWSESPAPTPRRSTIEFEAPAGTTFYYFAQAEAEGLSALGNLVGHLDRPLAADGRRLAVAMPSAMWSLLQTAAGTQIYAIGANSTAAQQSALALALENLLVTTRPPALLWANGQLTDGGLESGKLILRLPTQSLLPTLPDPYAASFEATSFAGGRDSSLGWIAASVTWTDIATPVMDFDLPTASAAPAVAADRRARDLAALDPEARQLFMLDLSSNADQFGVSVPVQSLAQVAIDGLSLVAPAASIGVFTLPPISWEPMLTKQALDAPLPPPPNDGGPALLAADSVTLVPVAPKPLLAEYVHAVNQKRNFAARLPLPFGIIANINTRPQDAGRDAPSPFTATGGVFDLHRPKFADDLVGARQLRLRAPEFAGMSRRFPPPSYTQTEDTDGYAAGVLSQDIHKRWQEDFGYGRRGIPLEHYELTGYGASLFSDWRGIAIGPAITQARFDVLVGRTGYEVIQMQSTKYPWCAKVVRTITIQRTNGGWVLREDSGWQPASEGLFHFPTSDDLPAIAFNPTIPPAFSDKLGQIHRGAVRGVVNIRNIRLAGPQFTVPPHNTIFRPVRFDADLLIDAAVTITVGGTKAAARIAADGTQVPAGTLVPSRDIDGYIQITGQTYAGTIDGKADPFALPADSHTIRQLFAARGSALAPHSCNADVGGTVGKPSVTLRAAQAAVGCDDNAADPHLVAALRGTPILPRDGAWSVGRMKATDTAPTALDPQVAVPLVRPAAGANGADKWHLADPADIRRLGDADKPTVIYGLLQSTGTQKTFYARPQAINGVPQIKVPQPPSFADVAALFNAAGIFPNLGDAFDFDTLSALDVATGDIGFQKQFTVKKVKGAPRETLLADLSIVQIVLRYGNENNNETVVDVTVGAPASPRWAISLKRVCFAIKYKSNDLIKMFADAKVDEATKPDFSNLNIHYVGFLSVLQDVFANVQQVARFLPGGAGAGLQVGFSQGRLTVRNEFALPNLPLGTGEITDIAVAMGVALQLSPLGIEFIAGLGSSEKPFRWVVSPLAGTGVVQVGVNNKGLDVLVQGGLGLGLAIDLGIAAGSAAITLAAEINTGIDPFELKVILSGRASVDVMRGLASATITLAAGLGISPPDNLLDLPVPPNFPTELGPYTIGFVASVAVGIHISICWVVDIDWDDYWQFRQEITTPRVSLPL